MSALTSRLVDRARGDVAVDPWGCDDELLSAVDAVIGAVTQMTVSGGDQLPADGPALLVANRRFGIAEPLVLGRAVRMAGGRPTRFVGVPDIAPLNTALRRLGGAVDDPAEVASLLRAGHLVGLPLAWYWRRPLMAGEVAPDQMAPAHSMGVPVLPVAIVGGELSGRWRVFFGAPLAPPRAKGPLALAELADAARHGVQALLDEAFPPRWPFS